MSDTKTYIVCQPSIAESLRKSFEGMDVEVDDNLQVPYEFRQRELTMAEMLEEEISREERQEADPKDAMTFIVPLVVKHDHATEDVFNNHYLSVRVQRGPTQFDVINEIKKVTPTLEMHSADILVSATIGTLKAALQKAGFNVLSISEAEGLSMMGEG